MQPDTIRLIAFSLIFVLMGTWEVLRATRQLNHSKPKRWSRNLFITLISSVIVRVLLPFTAISAALWAQRQNIGILNLSEISDQVFGVIVAVIFLDFCIYCQHVIFHVFPPLWRLHMMHHADQDYDLTTGSRFHPVEIVLSMLLKCAVVLALGASPMAVLIFEITLSSAAMFNHANVSITQRIDRVLRWIIVTPDMHRVHHSTEAMEAHSNYGFNLPWWDRLFSTYTDMPAAGYAQMSIGLQHIVDKEEFFPIAMLMMPFTSNGGIYPSQCMPERKRVALIGIAVFGVSGFYAAYELIKWGATS